MRSRPTLVSCFIPRYRTPSANLIQEPSIVFWPHQPSMYRIGFGPPLAIGAALSNRWTIVTSSSTLIPACPQIGKCLASELLCSDLISLGGCLLGDGLSHIQIKKLRLLIPSATQTSSGDRLKYSEPDRVGVFHREQRHQTTVDDLSGGPHRQKSFRARFYLRVAITFVDM